MPRIVIAQDLKNSADPGLYRVGEETFLVCLMMEFFQFFGRNRNALRPYRHGMELDPAQDRFAVLAFLKIAHRFVGVALEGVVLQRSEGEESEHVATRERGHEGLFRIGNFRSAEVIGGCRGPQGDAVAEVKIVITWVFLVAEALPVAVPVESDGVGAHVQQAVYGGKFQDGFRGRLYTEHRTLNTLIRVQFLVELLEGGEDGIEARQLFRR